jgi:hypothetical protein
MVTGDERGTVDEHGTARPLVGKRVAFVGKLGGVTKREAQQLVRQHGGIAVSRCQA